MRFEIKYPYRALYIPPRGRKWRETVIHELVEVDIREASETDAPIAARVRLNRRHLGQVDPEGWLAEERLFRWHDGSHYEQVRVPRRTMSAMPFATSEVFKSIGIDNFLKTKGIYRNAEERDIEPAALYKLDAPALSDMEFKEFDEKRQAVAHEWLARKLSDFLSVEGMMWKRIAEPVFVMHEGSLEIKPFEENLKKIYQDRNYLPLTGVEANREWFDAQLDETKVANVEVDVLLPESFSISSLRNDFMIAVEELLQNWISHVSGTSIGERTARWKTIHSRTLSKWSELRDEFLGSTMRGQENDLSDLLDAVEEFIVTLDDDGRKVIQRQVGAIERWRDRPLEITFG